MLIALTTIFGAGQLSFASSNSMVAMYDFAGDYTDGLGGSTLYLDSSASGKNFKNKSCSFGSSSNSSISDSSYWQWQRDDLNSGNVGGGFKILMNGDLGSVYSIALRFSFDNLDSGYNKIVDYNNMLSDTGFYFCNNNLTFYINGAQYGTNPTAIYSNDIIDLVATRTSSGRFIVYLIKNGTVYTELDLDDSTGGAIPKVENGRTILHFFHDDSSAGEATDSGKIYSLKIYNYALSSQEAKQALDTYTVAYNGNGSTGGVIPLDSNFYNKTNNTVTVKAGVPTLTGYTFIGWKNSINGNIYTSGQTFTISSNVTLTAVWEINQYTISFISNGGSAVEPITRDYNTVVTAPTPPTRTGYSFAGWYSDSALTSAYTFSRMTDNMTLYAKWNPNLYTITYMANGGSETPALTEYFDVPIQAPTEPTRRGYTFAGWYSDEALTTQYAFTTMPESVTLYAKWNPNLYTITFIANGGSETPALTEYFDAPIQAPTEPTRRGYTFTGWYSDEALETQYAFTIMPESITLYAKWNPNLYTITYIANGGSETPALTEYFDVPIQAPTEPTRRGYTFAGWYSDEALEMQYAFTIMPESITLYAKWNPNLYTITYITNGGSETPALTEYFDAPIQAPTEPTRTGYSFGGWYVDISLTNAYVFTTMPENITLYAKWTVNKYTVTFVTNGGNEISPLTVDYNTNIQMPPEPTKDGFVFAGWYTDIELTETYTKSKMPAEDFTLYAKWDEVSETEQETESETEPETEPETESENEPEAETEAETELETEAETELETEAEIDSETEAETELETEAETDSETEAETELETEAETELETEAETELEAESEIESETEAQPEAESEPEIEPKPEIEPELVIEPENKPEAENEPTTEPEVNTKPESDTEPNIDPSAEAESGTEPKPTSEVEQDDIPASADDMPITPTVLPDESCEPQRIRRSIEYIGDGCKLPAGTVSYIEYSDTPYVLPIPEMSDYSFEGWYKDANFTGEPATSISYADGDAKLYAKFSPAPLVYESVSMQTAAVDGVYYSEEAICAHGGGGITEYTLFGSIPKGLTLSPDGTISGTPLESGVFTIEVEAHAKDGSVKKSTHILNILPAPEKNEDPLTIISDSSFVYGENYYILTNADDIGEDFTYKIVGGSGKGYIGDKNRLYVTAAGTFILVTTAKNDARIILSEPFTVDVKKATLTVSSRSMAYMENDIIYASDINIIATGFVFGDNMMNDVDRSAFRMLVNGVEMPMGGYTLPTGEYEVTYTGLTSEKYNINITPFNLRVYKAYTAAFDLNGGEGDFAPITIQQGQPLPRLESKPIRSGYGFTGWYKDRECTQKWDFSYDTVSGDTTLYAGWQSDTCVVMFKYGGERADRLLIDVPSGSLLNEPEKPSVEGKFFAGWYSDSTCTQKWDFNTDTVDADLSLYAKFVTFTFKVAFNSAPGTKVETIENVGYDTLLRPMPSSPTLDGMHFAGWFYEESLETQFAPAFDTVKSDLNLYAKWIAKTYTVFGGVADCEGITMADIPVTLKQGQNELASSVTDENGLFRFVYVPSGIYTLEAFDEENGVSVSSAVTVIDEDVLNIVIILSPDATGSAITAESGAAGITVAGLDEIFTNPNDTNLSATDQSILRSGGRAVAEMLINMSSPALAESSEKLIEYAEENNFVSSAPYEFTIIKTISNAEDGKTLSYITETEADIVITLPLDTETSNRNGYFIIRDHFGELEHITTEKNERGEYIEVFDDHIDIHTKKFSIFSVCYDEQVVPSWSWLVVASPLSLCAVYFIIYLIRKSKDKHGR